jgi:hypothetical protein
MNLRLRRAACFRHTPGIYRVAREGVEPSRPVGTALSRLRVCRFHHLAIRVCRAGVEPAQRSRAGYSRLGSPMPSRHITAGYPGGLEPPNFQGHGLAPRPLRDRTPSSGHQQDVAIAPACAGRSTLGGIRTHDLHVERVAATPGWPARAFRSRHRIDERTGHEVRWFFATGFTWRRGFRSQKQLSDSPAPGT